MFTKIPSQRVEKDASQPQTKQQMTHPNNAQAHQLRSYQLMAQQAASTIQLKAVQSLMGRTTLQRVEEDDLQTQLNPVQRVEEEEPAQAKLVTVQKVEDEESLQAKSTNSGLPHQLKNGIESLSGMRMDHVKVNYNSDKPAQLNAHAYAQGSEIHVAPGQEHHLPHEAWHVVQQAQGRVQPTMQMKTGVPINDDAGLEREADVMGAKALGIGHTQLHKINQASAYASSTKTTQLKTTIVNYSQSYTYAKNKTQMVGKTMEAWLDPAQPIRGQSANLNTSQDDMMNTIREGYGIKGGNVVKGHLLNDNLGGSALSNNLFPITKGANSAHLGYVENVAKLELWKQGQGIYYRVDVEGAANINTPEAKFICLIKEWNPKTDKTGGQLLKVGVTSNLNDYGSKGAYHDVEDMDDSDEEVDREKNPKKPPGFVNPATKVGDLADFEVDLRNNDNNKTLIPNIKWTRG